MSSAASLLVLPRTSVVLNRSSCFNPPCSTFSDRTLTLTRAAAVLPPKLMVFSRENPRSCSFFNLSRSIKDGIDQTFLNFDREVEIPESAASDRTLCVGSSEGIVFVHNPTQLFAFDPLTATPFPLPPNSTLKFYPQAEGTRDECRFVEGKIILSPSRDMLVRLCFLDLEVASPGDDCWTHPKICRQVAHDLIFHKGLLYGLAAYGRLGMYGFKNGSLSKPYISVFKEFLLERKSRDYFFRNFLVESPDGKELFLVYRQSKLEADSTEYFKVFKLNKEVGKWKKVKKIGDMAIFVGINQSVSLRASDFPRILKPNSIYFTESHHSSCHILNRTPGVLLGIRGTGLYSLDDRSIQFFELTKGQEVLNWPDWPPAVWYIPPSTS